MIDKKIRSKRFSLVNTPRLEVLKTFVHQTQQLPGNIIEVGVYKGGTAELIAQLETKKKIYLCDTFEGLPYADKTKDQSWHKVGDFNDVSYNEIKEFFKPYNNVNVYKGLFPKETGYLVNNEIFSLIHLDVDMYQSYKECLDFLYTALVPHGIMIFDDYSAISCPGAKLAIDEFFKDKPEQVQLSVECQAYIIKI